MKTSQFDLLKTRRFLPLFIAQFLGAFNDNVFKNSLVILITYKLSNAININPQILVTFAAGIFILPFFLFSATAGELADKFEKSHLIAVIKFFEIIIMLFATLGFYLENVQLLLFVLFALGTQATFFGPLKYSLLPEQLHKTELIAGNGLIEAGTFMAILLGTIIGGLFILTHYGEQIIAVLILSMAFIGWTSSLFILRKAMPDEHVAVNWNFIKSTYQLVSYSKKQPELFICIIGISWFWLVGATFLAEFPVFVKIDLHANENIVTLFLSLFTIGLALGSLLCNKLLKGKLHANYTPVSAMAITLFTIDLYFAALHTGTPAPNAPLMPISEFLQSFTGWRMMIDLLGIAISGGLYTVPLYAILQSRSKKSYCARVIASNNVVNALFMVIAAIATMLMLKMGFSVAEVFLSLAIVNAGVSIYLSKLSSF